MSIFRCENYICATFNFEAKLRLASTELLFEVPSCFKVERDTDLAFAPKINIARDPTDYFGCETVKLAQLLMENPAITTRSHEKNVFDKIFGRQGPAWRSNFRHGPEILGFA